MVMEQKVGECQPWGPFMLSRAFKGKADTDHSSGHREGILNSGLVTKCFVGIEHLGENRCDLGGSPWPWVGKQRVPL